jgi:Secretion system C-terminal sorting domain
MKANFTQSMAKPFLTSILFIILSFLSASVIAQPISQTFTNSGTYVVPAGYTVSVKIEAWGAGGGGGVGGPGAKGGGAGGAYASSTVTLSPGSYTITVGLGGTPGVDGGSSSFANTVIAMGGGAAVGDVGGTSGSSTGSTGAMVIESIGGSNRNNNDGGAGAPGANGGGAGGTGGMSTNESGLAGIAPGGGGGGKAGPGAAGASGTGGDGQVRITILTVLAVKFTNIKAYEKQNGVQIDWTVTGEENMVKYQVEKSTDGNSFMVIGNVAAGNSSSQTTYNYLDISPAAKVNYYRIRTVAIDGRTTLSTIIKVNLDKTVAAIALYPNPVTDGNLSIQSNSFSKGSYVINIFNAGGQQVYTNTFSYNGGALNQTIQLPIGMKSGMYSIQLLNDGAKVMSKLFIVK